MSDIENALLNGAGDAHRGEKLEHIPWKADALIVRRIPKSKSESFQLPFPAFLVCPLYSYILLIALTYPIPLGSSSFLAAFRRASRVLDIVFSSSMRSSLVRIISFLPSAVCLVSSARARTTDNSRRRTPRPGWMYMRESITANARRRVGKWKSGGKEGSNAGCVDDASAADKRDMGYCEQMSRNRPYPGVILNVPARKLAPPRVSSSPFLLFWLCLRRGCSWAMYVRSRSERRTFPPESSQQ